MQVNITKHSNRLTATAHALAADYKHRGMDKYQAFDQFIIDRSLKPDLNAKEFYSLFASISPAPLLEVVRVDFAPTHYDTLLRQDCQITQTESGVYEIVWSDGHTGSNPPAYPPEPERYALRQASWVHPDRARGGGEARAVDYGE